MNNETKRITIDLINVSPWLLDFAQKLCTAIIGAVNNLPEPAQAVMTIVDLELEAIHEQ